MTLKPKAKWPLWLGGASTLVAILVGGQALGVVWPWAAEAREHAANTYETKENANKMYERFELEQITILNEIKFELNRLNEE